MTPPLCPSALGCLLAAGVILMAGCLPKPNTLATRSYVLSPLSVSSQGAAATGGPAVGIGTVRMPPYLLRPTIAVRAETNEIRYLEASLWAERLDGAFQRALAANLAAQIPTDRIRIGSWSGGEVDRAIYVTVERLDVDSDGTGTLHAWWRLTSGNGDQIYAYGNPHLTESGPPPAQHPEAIATTLSRLTHRLADALAVAVRASVSTPGTP